MVERLIDHSLYPRQAFSDARHAYKDYCTLKIEPRDQGWAAIQIDVKPQHEVDSRQIVLEFLNYALDRAIQLQLESS